MHIEEHNAHFARLVKTEEFQALLLRLYETVDYDTGAIPESENRTTLLANSGYIHAEPFAFEDSEGIYLTNSTTDQLQVGDMCLVFPYPFDNCFTALYDDMDWACVTWGFFLMQRPRPKTLYGRDVSPNIDDCVPARDDSTRPAFP